jgi:hypothetical protein
MPSDQLNDPSSSCSSKVEEINKIVGRIDGEEGEASVGAVEPGTGLSHPMKSISVRSPGTESASNQDIKLNEEDETGQKGSSVEMSWNAAVITQSAASGDVTTSAAPGEDDFPTSSLTQLDSSLPPSTSTFGDLQSGQIRPQQFVASSSFLMEPTPTPANNNSEFTSSSSTVQNQPASEYIPSSIPATQYPTARTSRPQLAAESPSIIGTSSSVRDSSLRQPKKSLVARAVVIAIAATSPDKVPRRKGKGKEKEKEARGKEKEKESKGKNKYIEHEEETLSKRQMKEGEKNKKRAVKTISEGREESDDEEEESHKPQRSAMGRPHRSTAKEAIIESSQQSKRVDEHYKTSQNYSPDLSSPPKRMKKTIKPRPVKDDLEVS